MVEQITPPLHERITLRAIPPAGEMATLSAQGCAPLFAPRWQAHTELMTQLETKQGKFQTTKENQFCGRAVVELTALLHHPSASLTARDGMNARENRDRLISTLLGGRDTNNLIIDPTRSFADEIQNLLPQDKRLYDPARPDVLVAADRYQLAVKTITAVRKNPGDLPTRQAAARGILNLFSALSCVHRDKILPQQLEQNYIKTKLIPYILDTLSQTQLGPEILQMIGSESPAKPVGSTAVPVEAIQHATEALKTIVAIEGITIEDLIDPHKKIEDFPTPIRRFVDLIRSLSLDSQEAKQQIELLRDLGKNIPMADILDPAHALDEFPPQMQPLILALRQTTAKLNDVQALNEDFRNKRADIAKELTGAQARVEELRHHATAASELLGERDTLRARVKSLEEQLAAKHKEYDGVYLLAGRQADTINRLEQQLAAAQAEPETAPVSAAEKQSDIERLSVLLVEKANGEIKMAPEQRIFQQAIVELALKWAQAGYLTEARTLITGSDFNREIVSLDNPLSKIALTWEVAPYSPKGAFSNSALEEEFQRVFSKHFIKPKDMEYNDYRLARAQIFTNGLSQILQIQDADHTYARNCLKTFGPLFEKLEARKVALATGDLEALAQTATNQTDGKLIKDLTRESALLKEQLEVKAEVLPKLEAEIDRLRLSLEEAQTERDKRLTLEQVETAINTTREESAQKGRDELASQITNLKAELEAASATAAEKQSDIEKLSALLVEKANGEIKLSPEKLALQKSLVELGLTWAQSGFIEEARTLITGSQPNFLSLIDTPLLNDAAIWVEKLQADGFDTERALDLLEIIDKHEPKRDKPMDRVHELFKHGLSSIVGVDEEKYAIECLKTFAPLFEKLEVQKVALAAGDLAKLADTAASGSDRRIIKDLTTQLEQAKANQAQPQKVAELQAALADKIAQLHLAEQDMGEEMKAKVKAEKSLETAQKRISELEIELDKLKTTGRPEDASKIKQVEDELQQLRENGRPQDQQAIEALNQMLEASNKERDARPDPQHVVDMLRRSTEHAVKEAATPLEQTIASLQQELKDLQEKGRPKDQQTIEQLQTQLREAEEKLAVKQSEIPATQTSHEIPSVPFDSPLIPEILRERLKTGETRSGLMKGLQTILSALETPPTAGEAKEVYERLIACRPEQVGIYLGRLVSQLAPAQLKIVEESLVPVWKQIEQSGRKNSLQQILKQLFDELDKGQLETVDTEEF